MKASIKKHLEAAEFFTDEGCHIIEIANDPTDETVSIARARVEPNVTTAWHRLTATVERYLIISGRGRVEIDGIEAEEVVAGDVVYIPAGVPQRIKNTGQEDLIFYCICSPRFKAENYHGPEQTSLYNES